MRLRVTRKHHTHAGKTYRVGDEFEGSERTLAAFGDRLEPVASQQIKISDKPKRGRPRKVKPNANASDSE